MNAAMRAAAKPAGRPGPGDWLAWLALRLGAPGLLGLALLLAAVAAHYGLSRPLSQDAAMLGERADRLASQPPQAGRTQAQAEPAFVAALPAAQQDARILAGLFAAAEAAGLVLDQGNYRLTVDRQAGLQRQQITLPVTGAYPALRAFMAEALARYPSLGLDGIHLTRDNVNAAQLKATLRFTLYLREGA